MIKDIPLLLFILVVVSSALGQKEFPEADVRIRGIRSGSSHASVVAKLGRPQSRTVEQFPADDSSCIPTAFTLVKLRYPGLEIELLGNGRGRDLRVVEMTVTSNRWSASSIRIGAGPAAVVRRFGKPSSKVLRDGQTIYSYVTPGNTGGVSFEFRNGRVSRILVSETLC